MPFVLLSPSHSVLKSQGLYKYCNGLGEAFFFFLNQVFVCEPLCKRLDRKS